MSLLPTSQPIFPDKNRKRKGKTRPRKQRRPPDFSGGRRPRQYAAILGCFRLCIRRRGLLSVMV